MAEPAGRQRHADSGDESGSEAASAGALAPAEERRPRRGYLDEAGLAEVSFAVEHDWYDVLCLDYLDGDADAKAYVIPVFGFEEISSGGP